MDAGRRMAYGGFGNTAKSNGTEPASTPPAGHHHPAESIPAETQLILALGCKHHVLVDQRGLPLVAQISGAQVHDSRLLIPVINATSAVTGLPGRARRRPGKLRADRAYGPRAHRAWLRRRGIVPCIARYGIESRERLGRWRWIVERILGWLHRFRRLRICYERRTDIHQAFLSLACSLICWRYVERFC